jgi:hypothetical protein
MYYCCYRPSRQEENAAHKGLWVRTPVLTHRLVVRISDLNHNPISHFLAIASARAYSSIEAAHRRRRLLFFATLQLDEGNRRKKSLAPFAAYRPGTSIGRYFTWERNDARYQSNDSANPLRRCERG